MRACVRASVGGGGALEESARQLRLVDPGLGCGINNDRNSPARSQHTTSRQQNEATAAGSRRCRAAPLLLCSSPPAATRLPRRKLSARLTWRRAPALRLAPVTNIGFPSVTARPNALLENVRALSDAVRSCLC